MSSSRIHSTLFGVKSSVPPVSEQFMRGTALRLGAVASLLGIVTGSVFMFGLIIRAQPDRERNAGKARLRGRSEKDCVKAVGKILVMRAITR